PGRAAAGRQDGLQRDTGNPEQRGLPRNRHAAVAALGDVEERRREAVRDGGAAERGTDQEDREDGDPRSAHRFGPSAVAAIGRRAWRSRLACAGSGTPYFERRRTTASASWLWRRSSRSDARTRSRTAASGGVRAGSRASTRTTCSP